MCRLSLIFDMTGLLRLYNKRKGIITKNCIFAGFIPSGFVHYVYTLEIHYAVTYTTVYMLDLKYVSQTCLKGDRN